MEILLLLFTPVAHLTQTHLMYTAPTTPVLLTEGLTTTCNYKEGSKWKCAHLAKWGKKKGVQYIGSEGTPQK